MDLAHPWPSGGYKANFFSTIFGDIHKLCNALKSCHFYIEFTWTYIYYSFNANFSEGLFQIVSMIKIDFYDMLSLPESSLQP